MNLLTHRRGSVALMTGIMAPAMVMTMAMGIEVTSWSVTNVELQRIADISAWAGAKQYLGTSNAQRATGTAADLAEVNGASGTANRAWNAATLTTTDNLITARVVSGVRHAADKAIEVTVKRNIAKSFSLIFPSSTSSVTVSATATAEIVSVVVGPQPCLVALMGDGDGVTTGTDVTISGSADVTATNCSVRSDAGITLNGSSSLNVGGTYAGGSITTKGSAVITGGAYANAGQIADPYAGYAPLLSAFSSLTSGGTAVDINNTTTSTINPGTYSSMRVNGSARLTLNPGLYIVNGNISFNGSSVVTGNGVTIVSSGTLSYSGSSSVSLAAPTAGSSAGGIPGILFASQSTAASSFVGSSSLPFSGLIYYPDGNLTFAGSSTSGTTGCTEIIAGTITLTGSSNLSASCASYGTLNFGSQPDSSSIALVQ